jgi:hypothetical protein
MPFDYGLRLNNRQRIANARETPIEANKNQSVDGAEGLFLRSGSPQNVYLLPQRQNFSLERCPRPKQICDHPNNEPDKISHPATASPDSRSTASQIEFATGTVYGDVFIRRLRAMSIRDRPTAPRSPWQNGYYERAIGSIRRECLDHVVVFGERHLRHLLRSYATYYNAARTHLSVNKDAPMQRTVHAVGRIVPTPFLSGLHHLYVRV